MNPKYRRILLKLSGETFGGSKGFGFDYDTISRIAENIISVIELKVEVGVVVGGGNIFRGAESSDGNIARVAGDHMGMLSTVINSICLQQMLEHTSDSSRGFGHGHGGMAASDSSRRRGPLIRLLDDGGEAERDEPIGHCEGGE